MHNTGSITIYLYLLLSVQAIPIHLQQPCEGLADILDLADKIYAIVTPPFPVLSVSPAQKSVAIPADKTVAVPPEKTVSVPLEKTLAIPTEKTVAIPAEKTVAVPIEKTVAIPAEKTVAVPIEKTVAIPAEKTVAVPVEKTVAKPAEKSVISLQSENTVVATLVNGGDCPDMERAGKPPAKKAKAGDREEETAPG
jgi:hypothetical protein